MFKAASKTALKMICVMADKQSGSNSTVLTATTQRTIANGIKIIGAAVGSSSSEEEIRRVYILQRELH